jgi:hypothetical protein
MQRVSCKRRHLGSCVTDTWPNLTPSMNFRRYAPASDGIPATKSLHDFDHLLFFFANYTIHQRHSQLTLIPMNTRTQTLPLGASSKTVPANPQD